MARRSGLSRSTISRIWRAFALQPHRTETFKLSADPLFVFDLAPFSWPGEGGSLLWGTPPHPPSSA